jgi:IS1 family transposase
MSRTPIETKIAAVGAITEGLSLRAVSRLTGLSRTRIGKLVLEMGKASERLLDENIRGFRCEQVECDELWTFIKKRHGRVRATDPADVGDAWVWTAVDPDSKLIPAHHVGARRMEDANKFMRQLRERIEGDVQLNTDRLHTYRGAIFFEFSKWNGEEWERPDWATVVKRFDMAPEMVEGRYAPPRVSTVEKRIGSGNPDMDRATTSHVEAHNLHFRMRNRRAARLTNAFSKSLEHLRAATATYYAHYNFVRNHGTVKTTPAVAAGLAERPWTIGEFVELGELYGR